MPNKDSSASLAPKIELFVADIDSSADFYGRVLGFAVGTMRRPPGGGPPHLPIRNGPVLIGLGMLSSLPSGHHLLRAGLDATLGVGVELCFYVENTRDLDMWYQRAKREWPASAIEAPGDRPWGARDFRVIDPDGYYIRISTPDADALDGT